MRRPEQQRMAYEPGCFLDLSSEKRDPANREPRLGALQLSPDLSTEMSESGIVPAVGRSAPARCRSLTGEDRGSTNTGLSRRIEQAVPPGRGVNDIRRLEEGSDNRRIVLSAEPGDDLSLCMNAEPPDQIADLGESGPDPADDDTLLAECRIETFRAGGPGGQHQNKTESGVRLTHLPTGIAVTARDSRSQHRNRQTALARLRAALEERSRPEVPRVPTRTPRSEKRKRLEEKRRRSDVKKRRQKPEPEE